MKPFRAIRQRRGGLSLLEMIIATATMATVMAAVVVLVRSGYGAWDIYENDLQVSENGHATLRHIVRHLRQADSVTAISAATDTSGSLSILTEGAATYTWDHDNATDIVYFDNGTGQQLLTWKIDDSLPF